MPAAAARGAEFLLMHRLYRADHHDFRVINPGWLELTFPWFNRYHILRGLWVLAKLGYRDARMIDALGVRPTEQMAHPVCALDPQGVVG